MQTSSPSSPVLAEKDAPAWERWLRNKLEAQMYQDWPRRGYMDAYTSKITPTSTRRDFCSCCGAFWITKGPGRVLGQETKQGHDKEASTNQLGIYFGEELSADDLVSRVGLVDAVTFEIKDGDLVHSFAWRDE